MTDRGPSAPHDPAEVVIRPGVEAWAPALAAPRPDAAADRAALGLPTDRPIVMSGHQCELWHPGILAKDLALREWAAHHRAAPAWVEVEQDSGTPWIIPYPTRDLARGRWRLGGSPTAPPDTPTGALPPVRAGDALPDDAHPACAPGLIALRDALVRHAAEPTLARQFRAARNDLLAWAGDAPAPVWALGLHATPRMRGAVDAMRRDPRACVAAFNDAARAHPDARVSPLDLRAGRVELPLWWVRPGVARRRVYADELAALPPGDTTRPDLGTLAPRALLLTGVLRAGACDLFIHGLGGERYDRVTEQWIGVWLGWTLSPTAVVTATLRLPLGGESLPEPRAVARAAWEAHRARHDPALLGDAVLGARKRDFIHQIARARTRAERATLYRAMHALLDDARARLPDALAAFDDRARAMHAVAARAGVAHDRTWPFPLHAPAALHALRRRVREALALPTEPHA